jgi:hypothetical protein
MNTTRCPDWFKSALQEDEEMEKRSPFTLPPIDWDGATSYAQQPPFLLDCTIMQHGKDTGQRFTQEFRDASTACRWVWDRCRKLMGQGIEVNQSGHLNSSGHGHMSLWFTKTERTEIYIRGSKKA